MDFKFNINEFMKSEVAVIRNDLLPNDYVGDFRSRGESVTKMTTILDEMGIASAKAQGLQKAITSGEKLRNSEHTVYLLVNLNDNDGKGSVIGLLKIGPKKLFVFDQWGYQHEVEPLCILDFYVHESRQRMGCGKQLFEFMLEDKKILPQKLAIDKPSEKFLAFLFKHYNLENAVPQMNNFVVFDKFFQDGGGDKERINHWESVKTTNRNSLHELYCRQGGGRHSAPKGEATMGMILQDPCTGFSRSSERDRGSLRNSWAGEGSPPMTSDAVKVGMRCPAADYIAATTPPPVVMGEKYRHSRLW